MEWKKLSILIIAVVLLPLTLYILPVLAAYHATIAVVTDTLFTSTDMASMYVTTDIDYLKTHGYITSTGLDTRVKYGGTAIPFLLDEDLIAFANPINSDSTTQFQFSTGNSALSNFDITIGDGGTITTTDNAGLEPSSNPFSIILDGYIDTATPTSNTTILSKGTDLQINVEATNGVISSLVNGTVVTATGVSSGEHEVELTRVDNDGDSDTIVSGNRMFFPESTGYDMTWGGARYAVVTSTGRIWVAYMNIIWNDEGSGLYAKYSDDEGATWSSEETIIEPTWNDILQIYQTLMGFALTIDENDTLHVIWVIRQEDTDLDDWDIKMEYKQRYNGSWTSKSTIYSISDTDPLYDYYPPVNTLRDPDIDCDGDGHLYVSWNNWWTGDYFPEVYGDHDMWYYFRKGTIGAGTTSWGTIDYFDPTPFYDEAGDDIEGNSAIDVDSNGLCHILYTYSYDDGVDEYHAVSYRTWNGSSFSSEIELYSDETGDMEDWEDAIDIIVNSNGTIVTCSYMLWSGANNVITVQQVISGIAQSATSAYSASASLIPRASMKLAQDNQGTLYVMFTKGKTRGGDVVIYYLPYGETTWIEHTILLCPNRVSSPYDLWKSASLIYNSWNNYTDNSVVAVYDHGETTTYGDQADFGCFIYTGTPASIYLSIDDTIEDSVATDESKTIPNNSSNWIMNWNTIKYLDYYSYELNEVATILYQPETIIYDDTLLNELNEGTYDGLISWGNMSAFDSITISSLESVEDPLPPSYVSSPESNTRIETDSNDMLGETGQPDITGTQGDLSSNYFYPIVSFFHDQSGISVSTIWYFFGMIFVILAMLGTAKVMPNHMLFILVSGFIVLLFLTVAMPIYPWWVLFIYVSLGTTFMVWERVPSV